MADGKVVYEIRGDDSQLGADLDKSTQTIKSKTSGWGDIAKTAAAGIGAAFTSAIAAGSAALMSLGKVGMEYNSAMEQYTTSFKTMLGGSEEMAVSLVGKLEDLAAKTPLAMEDIAKAAQTLLQFGAADYDNVVDTIRMIGDAALGDAQRLQSLTLAFSQVSSTGKLTGQDLLQMINAGFNPLAIIAEKTGRSIGELKEQMSAASKGKDWAAEMEKALRKAEQAAQDVEAAQVKYNAAVEKYGADSDKAQLAAINLEKAQLKLKNANEDAAHAAQKLSEGVEEVGISAEQIKQAFVDATSEGGLFFGAMEAQSQTLAGQMSTLEDNFKQFAGGITESLQPVLVGLVGTLSDVIAVGSPLQTALSDVFATIAEGAQGALPVFVKLIETLLPALTQIAADALPVLFDTFNSLMPVIQAFAENLLPMLSGAFKAIMPILANIASSVLPPLLNGFMGLMNSLAPLAEALLPVIQTLLAAIAPLFERMGEILQPVIDKFVEVAVPIINLIGQALQPLLDILTPIVDSVLVALADILVTLLDEFDEFGGLLQPILEIFEGLKPIFQNFADTLVPMLADAVKMIIPFLSDIAKAILPVLAELFGKVVEFTGKLAEKIMPVLNTLFEAMAPILDMVVEAIGPLLDSIMMLVDPLLELLDTILTPLMALLEPLVNVLLKALNVQLKANIELIMGVADAIAKYFKNHIESFMTILQGVIDFLTGVFTGNWKLAWEGIKEIVWGVVQSILGTIEMLVNGVISVINSIIGAYNTAAEFVGLQTIDTIGSVAWTDSSKEAQAAKQRAATVAGANRHKSGIAYVMEDWTPAYLDRGERVLTAEENMRYTLLGGMAGIESRIANGANTGRSPEINASITLTGDVYMDGLKVGTVVLRNLDDAIAHTVRG